MALREDTPVNDQLPCSANDRGPGPVVTAKISSPSLRKKKPARGRTRSGGQIGALIRWQRQDHSRKARPRRSALSWFLSARRTGAGQRVISIGNQRAAAPTRRVRRHERGGARRHLTSPPPLRLVVTAATPSPVRGTPAGASFTVKHAIGRRGDSAAVSYVASALSWAPWKGGDSAV